MVISKQNFNIVFSRYMNNAICKLITFFSKLVDMVYSKAASIFISFC